MFSFQKSILGFTSLLSDGKYDGFFERIINKLSDVVSLIDRIKLGQNIYDGTISMIKNETKSNPIFLQHEKERLTILNLQRYVNVKSELSLQ